MVSEYIVPAIKNKDKIAKKWILKNEYYSNLIEYGSLYGI